MNNITVYLFGKELKDNYSLDGVSRLIEKVKSVLRSTETRATNQSFLEKAPQDVIKKEYLKIGWLKETLNTLERILRDFRK